MSVCIVGISCRATRSFYGKTSAMTAVECQNGSMNRNIADADSKVSINVGMGVEVWGRQ